MGGWQDAAVITIFVPGGEQGFPVQSDPGLLRLQQGRQNTLQAQEKQTQEEEEEEREK